MPDIRVGVLTLAFSGVLLAAQTSGPTRSEVDAAGPRVGQPAIEFSLADARGESHTLKSILGPKGALLVFFRSADW